MNSYEINFIDEEGNAVVTVTIGDQQFVQKLLLPTDESEQTTILDKYVQDYAGGLANDKTVDSVYAELTAPEPRPEEPTPEVQ